MDKKVTVYYFRGFDIREGQFLTSPRMAQLDFIYRNHFEPIKESAIEVDESKLDRNGLYLPPAKEGKL